MSQEWNVPLNLEDSVAKNFQDVSNALESLGSNNYGATDPRSRAYPATAGAVWVDATDDADQPRVLDGDGSWRPLVCVKKFAVTHADLTDAVNGEAQVVDLWELPAGYKILGATVTPTTQFSGGSIATLAVDLGTDADDSWLISAYDGLATPGDTEFEDAAIYGSKTKAAETLVATFTPDASHNLADLTAGEITFTITFFVQ